MNDPAVCGQGSDKDFYLKAIAGYGELNPLVGLIFPNPLHRRELCISGDFTWSLP